MGTVGRRIWGALFGMLAATVLLGLAIAPRADAALYWDTGSISRANLDASNVQLDYISNQGVARFDQIDVHGNYLYWVDTNPEHRWIGRVRLDGTQFDPDFIVPGTAVFDIAVNDSGIYWTDGSTFGRIARADLDGGNFDPSFISTAPSDVILFGITATESHIYWEGHENSFPGADTIGRASTDGSNVDPRFISDVDPNTPFRSGFLADSSDHIYWTNGGAIGRARLDGSEVNFNLISPEAAQGVSDIAVAGGAVFWSRGTDDNDEPVGIGRANLDGTSPDPRFLPPDVFANHAIAADELVVAPDCSKLEKKVAKAKKKLKKADSPQAKARAKKKLKKAKKKLKECRG